MNTSRCFLATLHTRDGQIDLSKSNLALQLLRCEVLKIVFAHPVQRHDGQPVVLGHQQKQRIHAASLLMVLSAAANSRSAFSSSRSCCTGMAIQPQLCTWTPLPSSAMRIFTWASSCSCCSRKVSVSSSCSSGALTVTRLMCMALSSVITQLSTAQWCRSLVIAVAG